MAGDYPIIIEQGATWPDYEESGEAFITVTQDGGTPIDLTGWTAILTAWANYDAEPFLKLTTDDGGITLGGVAGTVDLYLSAADTSGLTTQKGVYNLKLISPGGSVLRLLQGTTTVSREGKP